MLVEFVKCRKKNLDYQLWHGFLFFSTTVCGYFFVSHASYLALRDNRQMGIRIEKFNNIIMFYKILFLTMFQTYHAIFSFEFQ